MRALAGRPRRLEPWSIRRCAPLSSRALDRRPRMVRSRGWAESTRRGPGPGKIGEAIDKGQLVLSSSGKLSSARPMARARLSFPRL